MSYPISIAKQKREVEGFRTKAVMFYLFYFLFSFPFSLLSFLFFFFLFRLLSFLFIHFLFFFLFRQFYALTKAPPLTMIKITLQKEFALCHKAAYPKEYHVLHLTNFDQKTMPIHTINGALKQTNERKSVLVAFFWDEKNKQHQ